MNGNKDSECHEIAIELDAKLAFPETWPYSEAVTNAANMDKASAESLSPATLPLAASGLARVTLRGRIRSAPA